MVGYTLKRDRNVGRWVEYWGTASAFVGSRLFHGDLQLSEALEMKVGWVQEDQYLIYLSLLQYNV